MPSDITTSLLSHSTKRSAADVSDVESTEQLSVQGEGICAGRSSRKLITPKSLVVAAISVVVLAAGTIGVALDARGSTPSTTESLAVLGQQGTTTKLVAMEMRDSPVLADFEGLLVTDPSERGQGSSATARHLKRATTSVKVAPTCAAFGATPTARAPHVGALVTRFMPSNFTAAGIQLSNVAPFLRSQIPKAVQALRALPGFNLAMFVLKLVTPHGNPFDLDAAPRTLIKPTILDDAGAFVDKVLADVGRFNGDKFASIVSRVVPDLVCGAVRDAVGTCPTTQKAGMVLDTVFADVTFIINATARADDKVAPEVIKGMTMARGVASMILRNPLLAGFVDFAINTGTVAAVPAVLGGNPAAGASLVAALPILNVVQLVVAETLDTVCNPAMTSEVSRALDRLEGVYKGVVADMSADTDLQTTANAVMRDVFAGLDAVGQELPSLAEKLGSIIVPKVDLGKFDITGLLGKALGWILPAFGVKDAANAGSGGFDITALVGQVFRALSGFGVNGASLGTLFGKLFGLVGK